MEPMNYKPPKILVEALGSGQWKSISSDALRRFLGDDLDDLELFQGLHQMMVYGEVLLHAKYVNMPQFCMTQETNLASDDPRLEYSRAFFIAASIVPGDDVFVAIRQEVFEDYDPEVLVFDWRKEAPHRWTGRGRLSTLIARVAAEE